MTMHKMQFEKRNQKNSMKVVFKDLFQPKSETRFLILPYPHLPVPNHELKPKGG